MVSGARYVRTGPVGGPAAREAARRELSRPEYHRQHTDNWITRLFDWLGDHLGRVFGAHAGAGGHALLIVVVILVVAAVVFAARAGRPVRRRVLGDTAPSDPLAPASAVDHRRRAARLAADGRHADALREWLRAAVATIEDRGVLPPRPGRTGARTAREAGPQLPAAAAALQAATAAFDEVWFGGRDATVRDSELGRDAADRVQSAHIGPSGEAARADGIAVPR